MHRKIIILLIGLTFLSCIQSAVADTTKDKILKKVISGYGGQTLSGANSISITDFNKGPWFGQSENPGVPEIWRINEILTIDFENKRKSMLSWRVSRTSKDLDRFVFDGVKGRIDDILNKKYAEQDWLTYDSLGRSVSGRSDTMIAYELAAREVKTSYDGEAMYRGIVHQKLKINIGTSTEKTLYINKTSGLIAKAIRQHPRAGELVYVFSNHKISNGITFARDMNFFVDGKLRLLSVERDVKVNPSLENVVFEPTNYQAWGDTYNGMERSINKLADNVYHVGKSGLYTLFADAGDYFIASGGGSELKSNFQALKEFTGVNKPIKYLIVTHHHTGQLRVLNEAIALDANIVTVKDHLPTIKNYLSKTNINDAVTLINGTASFGDNTVKVYDIATAHSEHYLAIYLPKSKIIFGEDHFATELIAAMPRVHKDMVNFGQAIKALNIPVESYVDASSPRQLSKEEFNAATNAYKNVTCPKGYQVCE